jgi:cation diffusion facilitator CzcD-associated flavoprotein CzcO
VYYNEYRRGLEMTLAGAFEALWRGSIAQVDVERITISHMKEIIHDQKVLKALVPKFEVGCRRFTPGDHYLHAIQQENVEMLSDRIVSITESGITDSTGVTRDVDAIVCATGFDASYEPRFPVIGRDGYSLAENWGMDKPTESYMGAAVARFPNFFGEHPFPFLLSMSLIIRRYHDLQSK